MDRENIGIIAGGGQFPLNFIEAAKRENRRVVVVAHKGETSQQVADAADAVCWVKLGQLGRLISFFKKEGVAETVFLGTITKTRIFRDVLPDLKALALWNKIDRKQDDAILRAIANLLESEGIMVLESTTYLEHLLFPPGVLTKARPNKAQRRDIEFGWYNAREIGRLDIGQCVVVRDCTVLAVEAIEGTDKTILRGGKLAGEKAVVVKVRKPGQDFRFDLPATGLATVQTLARVKGSVLAVEAGQSLVFDREEMIKEADRAGIVVVGVVERDDGTLEIG
ncbi:LpxI family protein [Desulforhopalus singaporensis]|uniref:LpxI family protein n=1 Tax=Desulforhopalus singaporensis TaxID=91360 RepID=UPI0015A4CBA3|nr:UDP-2,3-diacylglucosamine diphosphatase LpxI [Desulforhopalus singaporensis]